MSTPSLTSQEDMDMEDRRRNLMDILRFVPSGMHLEIAGAARLPGGVTHLSDAAFSGGDLAGAGEELSMSEQLDNEQDGQPSYRNDANLEKIVNNMLVVYGPGAEVKFLKLHQEMSNIQVFGLSKTADRLTVVERLKQLGFDVKDKKIEMHRTNNGQGCAIVQLEDTATARRIVEKVDAEMLQGNSGGITVKLVTNNDRFGNWVNSNTVSVSWFKRSKTAMIASSSSALLKGAKNILSDTNTPSGRTLRCKPLRASRRNRTQKEYMMTIENLDWNVGQDWLKVVIEPALMAMHQQGPSGELPRPIPPIRYIRIMETEYKLNEEESGKAVQALLRRIGSLELFDVYDEARSIMIKAEATFVNAQHALEAVEILNATTHPEFGKIAVELVSSTKLNINKKIVIALRLELDKFERRICSLWKLKMKYSTSAEKPYTIIQLWGVGPNSRKKVASSRSMLEKLLEGTIVLVDGKAFWDHVFRKHEGLAMLEFISRSNGVYIHRDLSLEYLVIYGGNYLTHGKLAIDLYLGICKLREPLNTSITLGPPLAPVLQAEPQDCAVCLSAPEKPMIARCGHVYCTECFLSQISYADGYTLPLLCHGAEDTCKHVFGLKELKERIPFAKFQDLLVVAHKTYIRTHATEYAYCPTPDCESVYRVHQLAKKGAKDGDNIFFCNECLSSTCMTCGTPTHNETTCRENKAAEAKLMVYMAKTNTKRCSKCRTLIEKNGGCNHMVCPGCKTNICWVCEAAFPTEPLCYSHLMREHGGY